ncbi:MAG: small multi-drug export protein [Planctomycetes bacterium]|nr:small multi-drug export protein [Planctomycetota bacterium]
MSADAPTARPSASETRLLAWVWLGSLGLLIGTSVAWFLLTEHDDIGWIWGQMIGLATIPGKYMIFSGLSSKSLLGPWELCLLAILVDFAVGATLAVGLGPLRRVPGIGPALKRAHDRAEAVLKEYPRLRRMAFWGVVVFVFLPLPASGSIGGTFVGQMAGLTRSLGLWAVVLGGSLVSITFAALAVALGSQAEAMVQNPWVTAGAAVVFIGLLALGYRAAQRALRA